MNRPVVRYADGTPMPMIVIGQEPVAVWEGPQAGLMFETVAAMKGAVETAIAKATDLKSAPIGDQERAERVAAIAREALAAINPRAAVALDSVRAVSRDIAAVNPVGDPRALSFLEVCTDLEVASALKTMPAVERAAVLAQLRDDPMAPEVRDYARAAIRTPAVLTGLTPREHRALTLKTFEVAEPQRAEALKTAATHAGNVIAAARVAARELGRLGAPVGPDQPLSALAQTSPPTWG